MVEKLIDVAHLRTGMPLELCPATVDLVALAEDCIKEA
jgi:hypothetical protein